MKKISGDLDRDPINPRWAPDGSGVFFDAQDRGSQNIYFASPRGGAPKLVTTGTHILTLGLDVERPGRGRHPDRSGPSAGRRQVQPQGDAAGDAADRRQCRSARGQAAREDRRDLVHVHRRHQGAGLDRQAAGVRPGEEVSADPRDPRRPVRDVQRRVQLHVPELRREQLRGALHQSARQHRLRRRVLGRHRSQLPGARLRRPDGGRGRRHRARATWTRRGCTCRAAAAAACFRAG